MASGDEHRTARPAGSISKNLTYSNVLATGSTAADQQSQDGSASGAAKKRKHRGGKKRRNRRQSFAAPADEPPTEDMTTERPSLLNAPSSSSRSNFYRLGQVNRSNTSLESEALLDHRDQAPLQTRRQSIQGMYSPKSNARASPGTNPAQAYPFPQVAYPRSKLAKAHRFSEEDQEEEDEADDRTPLISSSGKDDQYKLSSSYGGLSRPNTGNRSGNRARSPGGSSTSSRKANPIYDSHHAFPTPSGDYDVNNPPSVPGSPRLGPGMGYDDVMLTGRDVSRSQSPEQRKRSRDILIDIDENTATNQYNVESTPPSPKAGLGDMRRRATIAHPAEVDVCFPQEGMSEIGQDDYLQRQESTDRPGRRRRRVWPDLSVLEEWKDEEKEQRTMEGIRARKVSEPILVGGRLRPQKSVWHREADDAPFRFTYFNEEFQSTIHSQSISELLQPGQTFKDLFIPEPPLLSDDSSEDGDEDDPNSGRDSGFDRKQSTATSTNGTNGRDTRQSSRAGDKKQNSSGEQTGTNTPTQSHQKQKRYGPRPVFWLDVLSPTDAEMRVLSKAFGIHPLTAEDIMMQEAREKVELFRHYYFVNYRTFEQDTNSEDYLEPVNMYVVVFREGVISFHFSMTPHPANVRRRIRQLSDYLILSSDWISYAIIDDITDVYAPLIERIEDEVDDIDDAILRLHSPEDTSDQQKNSENEKSGDGGDCTTADSGGDMLRRVGECRKKVMGLYRLLGTKADVIKGFAKRCNEQWEVAPRSEIGLYLGDIQDHIVTMTGNLSHYENLLSRAHSNYLAQINIRMNERAEQTNDVLGKLTVLGTIVLPMNIVTGMWGMNVLVPGQDVHSLAWFWGISGGLLVFGLVSFFIAKRYLSISESGGGGSGGGGGGGGHSHQMGPLRDRGEKKNGANGRAHRVYGIV